MNPQNDPRAIGPRVRRMLPGMSSIETRIVEILMHDPIDASLPLKRVASEAGASEAMVVKTAKKLGFDGFRELRAAIVDYRRQPTVDLHQELAAGDSIATIVQKVFKTSIQALEETQAILDPADLERAARLVFAARQRDLYGLGGSAQIARDVAHKFLRIGIRTSIFDDTHMMAMSASLLGPGDLVLAFSHSGRSAGVVEATQLAKRNGASVVMISNYDTGPLAELADIVLCSTANGSPLTGENAAARIAQQNLMDVIFVAVAHLDAAAAEAALERTMAAVRTKRR